MERGGLGYQPVAHPPISSLIGSTPTIRSLVGTWTNGLECPPKFYSHVPANSYSMALCLAYGIHTGYIICLQRKDPGKKPMQVLEAGLSRLVREFQGSSHKNHVYENFDLAGSLHPAGRSPAIVEFLEWSWPRIGSFLMRFKK